MCNSQLHQELIPSESNEQGTSNIHQRLFILETWGHRFSSGLLSYNSEWNTSLMSQATESRLSQSCCWDGGITPTVGVVVGVIWFSQVIGRCHQSNEVPTQTLRGFCFTPCGYWAEYLWLQRHKRDTMTDRWVSVFKAKEEIHNTLMSHCCWWSPLYYSPYLKNRCF